MSERWLDDEAGPIIRPYTMTRGRTRPSGEQFDLLAVVTLLPGEGDLSGLAPEHHRVLEACQGPLSVAEVASRSGLPLAVTRVLLGDLRDRGLVAVRPPSETAIRPKEGILLEVLQGLRAL